MKYYIVRDYGIICWESESYEECEKLLSNYSEKEIYEKGMEIIDDTEYEELYCDEEDETDDYSPLYADDDRQITIEKLERLLVERYGTDIECGCNTWEGGWFSVKEILELVSENV